MTKPQLNSHEPHANFRQFWERVCLDGYQRLHREARKLARDNLDPDDLVQETVCRAITRCADPSHVEKPVGYLLGMMHNIWRDMWHKERYLRRRSSTSLEDIVEADHPIVNPETLHLLELEQSVQNLRREFNAKRGPLTDREEYLLLMHFTGYKNTEIAEKLGEDVRVTRSDLNATIAKVRYRMNSKKTKRSVIP